MGNFSLESLQKEIELLKKRVLWLETVLKRVPAMLYISDNDRKVVTWCNQLFEENTGYSRAEAQDMGPQFFQEIMHPEDFRLTLLAQESFRNNKSMFSGVARIRKRGQNDWRWVLGTAVPFSLKEDGGVQEIVSAFLELSVAVDTNQQLADAMGEVLRRQHESLLSKLTGREKEVLALAVKGLNNKEIALQLNLSRYTVETHRKNIRLKLKVRNMTELTAVARKIGFL